MLLKAAVNLERIMVKADNRGALSVDEDRAGRGAMARGRNLLFGCLSVSMVGQHLCNVVLNLWKNLNVASPIVLRTWPGDQILTPKRYPALATCRYEL